MGLFLEKKQLTAITTITETLVSQGIQYDNAKLVSLIQLINEHKSSSKECGIALRKILKNGSLNEKACCMIILDLLVDNARHSDYLVCKSKLEEPLMALAVQYTDKRRASSSKEQRVARNAYNLLHKWATSTNNGPVLSKLYARAGLKSAPLPPNSKPTHPDDDLDNSMFVQDSKSPFADPSTERTTTETERDLSSRSLKPDNSLQDKVYPASQFRRTSHTSVDENLASNLSSIHLSEHPDQDLDVSIFGAPKKNASFRESLGLKPSDNSQFESSTSGESDIDETIKLAHGTSSKLLHLMITSRESLECETVYNESKLIRKKILGLVHSKSKEAQLRLDDLLTCNEELISALQSYNSMQADELSNEPNPFDDV